MQTVEIEEARHCVHIRVNGVHVRVSYTEEGVSIIAKGPQEDAATQILRVDTQARCPWKGWMTAKTRVARETMIAERLAYFRGTGVDDGWISYYRLHEGHRLFPEASGIKVAKLARQMALDGKLDKKTVYNHRGRGVLAYRSKGNMKHGL